ncbi:hypothetical protein NHQ30_011463 [Ciborinia camelliae]|nr:hypothetical protein NHQ30_011463 [Ciborinia camelliae]
MRYTIAIAAIVPFVAAHGKIAAIVGDQGGNTTGLGIQGASVPGAGRNKVTEVDTTVFNSKNAATDGLGKTSAGPNTMADMKNVMAMSGEMLPQVSDGGDLMGTIHIVTTDGAGPYTAIVDPTGTGAFSQGTQAKVTTQVPGNRGNIAAPKQRSLMMRSLVGMGIVKRASNVNEDYPIKVSMPPGMACTGTVGGQSNVCLVKLANPSGAGPFGGVAAFQMAPGANKATAAVNVETVGAVGAEGASGAAGASTKAAEGASGTEGYSAAAETPGAAGAVSAEAATGYSSGNSTGYAKRSAKFRA